LGNTACWHQMKAIILGRIYLFAILNDASDESHFNLMHLIK